jgi:hypothetical protein
MDYLRSQYLLMKTISCMKCERQHDYYEFMISCEQLKNSFMSDEIVNLRKLYL